jgi:hypothetical protein
MMVILQEVQEVHLVVQVQTERLEQEDLVVEVVPLK